MLPHQSVQAATHTSYAGAITTGGGSLNVRTAASTKSSIVAILKKGSYVTLIEKNGSWWKVEYADNKYGYCHADYITAVDSSPMQVRTNGDVLNVRSGPSTAYSRISTLPHGTTVLVRKTENGWSQILYHGTKLGYVSSLFLSGSSQPTYPEISLSVPSFKQTDSRWAGYPLGTRGGTIGTIGCAVTGIAMMESYRTGDIIYPNDMAKKLSFSSGGAVYWPSHFTVNAALDLSQIYSLLQQGKPVLIGGKTASGGQHWVVITGYSGGETLTASNFTIHDPGSNNRVTLQQFFKVFPNFYKYFHY